MPVPQAPSKDVPVMSASVKSAPGWSLSSPPRLASRSQRPAGQRPAGQRPQVGAEQVGALQLGASQVGACSLAPPDRTLQQVPPGGHPACQQLSSWRPQVGVNR